MTLTSPHGRTASATSYRSNAYSAYVRADVSLAWDDNDIDDYTEVTRHMMTCPYMGGYPMGSTTNPILRTGTSYTCYKYDPSIVNVCSYVTISPCPVYCQAG